MVWNLLPVCCSTLKQVQQQVTAQQTAQQAAQQANDAAMKKAYLAAFTEFQRQLQSPHDSIQKPVITHVHRSNQALQLIQQESHDGALVRGPLHKLPGSESTSRQQEQRQQRDQAQVRYL